MQIENWLYTIPLRLRSLVSRNRLDADLDEELRDHIDRQTEENLARGMGKEEARLAALRTFGNLVVLREQTHETWAWAPLEQIWQNFRYAVRSARRAPALSSVAVLALALGIGLNTGVFTMLNAMFLRAPALVEPPRPGSRQVLAWWSVRRCIDRPAKSATMQRQLEQRIASAGF